MIKGVFVNSHIKAVRSKRGQEGVQELERRFGRPLRFRNSEDVPVADEVRLIELAVDLLSNTPLQGEEREFEAGRLHFANFAGSPLGRIVFSVFKRQYKRMIMTTHTMAGHIFKGVHFAAEDLGEKRVRLTTKNNDYPVGHLQGLFQEWMDFSGLTGTVEARVLEDNAFEYTMSWD